MYRDELRALEGKLESLKDARAEVEAAQAEVEGETRALRRQLARGRRWRWWPIAALVGGLAVTGAFVLVRVRQASALYAEKVTELDAIFEEIAELNERLVDPEGRRRRLDVRLRTQGQQVDPGAVAIFAELRYVPLSNENAWLIVGGAACALRDDASRAEAEAAIDEDQKRALAELCALREEAP